MTIHSEHLKLDKWLCAMSEQSTVHQAASYSLRNRLASLQQFFPRAVISIADCVEDVHQLRIATRRVFATLDLYAEFLPTKPTKLLRRSLKKIHRASGSVRDLDVLAKRYRKVEHNNAKKLVKALGRRRSRMQLRLTKLYLRLRRGDHFLNQTEMLLEKIETSDNPNELAKKWMKMRWSQLVERFYRSTEVDIEDLEALHRLRISGKQLRYGLELLAPTFDPKRRECAYEFVERLQNHLGQLQDHVVAHKLFCKWKSKRNRICRSCDLNQLLDGEKETLQKARFDFAAWWTPPIKAELRQVFDQLAV